MDQASSFGAMHYWCTMIETDAERFRKEAEDCRRQADTAKDANEKEYWLQLESDWLKLAEAAEIRRPRF